MLSEVGRYGQSIGAWSSGVVRLEEFAAFACVGSEVGPFCFACMGKGASVKWRILLALGRVEWGVPLSAFLGGRYIEIGSFV